MPGVRCERVGAATAWVCMYPRAPRGLPSTAVVPGRARTHRRLRCTRHRQFTNYTRRCWSRPDFCGVDTGCYSGQRATLAFGTDSVCKVDKIFGPGSAWVTAAKQIVAADAGAAIEFRRTLRGPGDRRRICRRAICSGRSVAQAYDTIAQVVLVAPSPRANSSPLCSRSLQTANLSRRDIVTQSVANWRTSWSMISPPPSPYPMNTRRTPHHPDCVATRVAGPGELRGRCSWAPG